jgi:hypothetical protein
MKQLCAAAALVLSCWTTEAMAEVPEAVVELAQSQAFAGRRTAALYSVEMGGGSWDLISVFSQPFGRALALEPDAPRRWVARRQSGRGSEFSTHVRWADSRTCPALEGVLWSLSRLEIASIDIPGITPPKPLVGVAPVPLTADGPVFAVWGAGLQPSGAPMTVSASGVGGELNAWGRFAERALAECWSEEQPTA